MANLVSNLGGTAGFGENSLTQGEFASGYIDFTDTFPNGLSYFGKTVTGMTVLTNGSVILQDNSTKEFVQVAFIACFEADASNTASSADPSPGGTSKGTGRIYWDLDPVNYRATITWDDLISNRTTITGSNAFQLTLADKSAQTGTAGDFDIVVRYEDIEWLDAGSTFAGITVPFDFRPEHYGPQSSHALTWAYYGEDKALLDLPTASNIGVPGVFNYQVRNALPTDLAVSIDPLVNAGSFGVRMTGGSYAALSSGVLESTGASKPLHFTVTRTGPLDGALDVNWAIRTDTGFRSVDSADFGGAPLSGIVHFAAGDATARLTFQITGDAVVEGNEEIDITFWNDGILASVHKTIALVDDEAQVLVGGDTSDSIVGAGGNDILRGRGGYDTLYGEIGNDILDGGANDDFLDGGSGNDTASYEDSAAAVFVNLLIKETSQQHTRGAGNDYLQSIENLTGSAHNDTLIGNGATNVLTGLGGNDRLDSRGGGDTLVGGTGNDTYVVWDSADSVVEQAGSGTDRILARVSASIASNVERLDLVGTAAIDGTGNAAANVIVGNTAANVITGGGGADRFTGRAGGDTFVFPASGPGAAPVIVTDFVSGTDRLSIQVDVGAPLGDHAGAALTEADFVLGSRATTADQHLIYYARSGTLFYDPDGAGEQAQIKLAVLLGHPDVHASDIDIIAF